MGFTCPYGWVECAYWHANDECHAPIGDPAIFVDCCPCFAPDDIPDEILLEWL